MNQDAQVTPFHVLGMNCARYSFKVPLACVEQTVIDSIGSSLMETSMLHSETASATRQGKAGVGAKSRQLVKAEDAWRKGVALAKARRLKEAAGCFEQAVKHAPSDSLYWVNLGNVLSKLHRTDEAMEAATRAIALDAYNMAAAQLKAKLLRGRDLQQEALEVLTSMPTDTKLDPMYHVLVGACHASLGQPVKAAQSFLSAMTLQPDHRDAHMQLGFNLLKLRRHAEAAECFRTVLAVDPKGLDAAMYAVHYASWACDWDAVDRDKVALADCIDRLGDQDRCEAISPFCLLAISDDPQFLRVLTEWDMRRFSPLPEAMSKRVRQRQPGERLRVGMVSSDFYHHATSMLLADTLEKMDHQRVELFLYSHGPDDNSELRRRMHAAADHFVECRGLSTQQQARMIHDDGIDVLIDLKGFTQDSRISVFSYRPAPVQAAWLGYPGTCGAPFMDYIIGDPVVTPAEHAADFIEHIAQLPQCYQPNDGTRTRLQDRTRQECGLPDDALVFSSFNQSYKITREVFTSWCRILQRVPGSVLWLLVPDEPVQKRLRQEAVSKGIDAARLVFADFEHINKHRRRIPLADINLDTFPCGGHTTASDALWGGVPTLALQGHTFASRVAPSLLTAVGLTELICHDLAQYENKAVALAGDPAELGRLRAHLVRARDEAPLFNSQQLAHDLMDLWERMWSRASSGQGPDILLAQG